MTVRGVCTILLFIGIVSSIGIGASECRPQLIGEISQTIRGAARKVSHLIRDSIIDGSKRVFEDPFGGSLLNLRPNDGSRHESFSENVDEADRFGDERFEFDVRSGAPQRF